MSDPYLNPFEKEAALYELKSGTSEWQMLDWGYCDGWRNKTFKFSNYHWSDVMGQYSDLGPLYRRHAFKEVETRLAEGGKYVWLNGPSGSGKSVSAFFFARDLSMRSHGPNRRRILWLQMRSQSLYLIDRGCVIRLRLGLTTRDLCKLHDISEIFVDQFGFYSKDHSLQFGYHILPWSMQCSHRKVTIIPAVDMDPPCVDPFDWNMVTVPPWTLQDYGEALMIPELKQQFLKCTKLNNSVSHEELMSTAREHFYYAGGSARYFFTRTTSVIVEDLNKPFIAKGEGIKYWQGRFRSSQKSHQILSGYAALVLGSQLPLERFMDEILSFEKVDNVANLFEAFVISCIKNRHCTPPELGGEKVPTTFVPVACGINTFGFNTWFIPHRVPSGVLCFMTTQRGPHSRFLFVIPCVECHHNVFTSDLVEVANFAVRLPSSISSHVQFDVYFSIPLQIKNQFKQNIVGEISGCLENGSKWSLGARNVHIWTIGGFDRFY